MRLFIDTTLIVEAAVSEEAARRLDRFCDGHVTVTNSNVLGEAFIALTKKKGRAAPLMLADAAVEVVRTAAAVHEVMPVPPEDVLEALRLRQKHQIGFWDALNAATAIRAKCDRMLTMDLPSTSLSRELVCLDPLKQRT